MTQTFFAVDNEFAVSTGSNVDSTPNSSTFDNPPNGSKDLVITSNASDTDPLLFELGETYDVTWGGQGGGGTILNAVVIRSDDAPTGDGGIIVFEGVDENGDPAQVIWTPGFDLEGWYNDNFNPSMEPQFYTEDINAAYTHRFVCFAAGTLIDTAKGPIAVETLRPDDRVQTLDAGLQPVIWVGQRDCVGFRADAPVTFDTGTIGNTRPLRVSAQHRILIRSAHLELCYGNSEMLAPAKAFAGLMGVRIVPQPTIRYVHVLLEAHQVIFANAAPCESLFLGDTTLAMLDATPTFSTVMHKTRLQHDTHFTTRPVLPMQHAARFLSGHSAQCHFNAGAPTLDHGVPALQREHPEYVH